MEFIAFDLETTGINPSLDKIIEIGAVRFSGSNAMQGFGHLINPEIHIPNEASTVNGITDEMVKDKPKVQEILGLFAEFCGNLPLVAHNASFDFKFLLEDVKLYKSLAPKGCVLDTLALSRKVFPGMPNYKLWTLVRHFNFPSGTFHRAEEDSSYCGLLFAKIIETLEKRKEANTVDDLLKIIGKDKLIFPEYKDEVDQLDLF
ncbi:MAG: PolC-type DNA polymerase III [Pontiellaceae bacterium]